MPECGQIGPLLAAFAFDALDERERAAVQAHLEGCPACRCQLALYRTLPGFLDLAGAGEPKIAAPPPLLEATVVAGIPAAHRSTPRAGARIRRLTVGRQWAAVGALVVALGVAAAVAALLSRSRAAPSAIRLTLASSGLQPHAVAQVLLRKHPWGTEVDLVAQLAPTHGKEVYEVWFVAAHGRLSAGTFTVPAGRRQVSVRLASAARLGRLARPGQYRYLGITLQPSGLDPGRLGSNVLRVRLPT